MEEIIARLKREADTAKKEYISMICEIVVRHIEECPDDVERITSDKTLKGCFDFLRERASKNQSNGCGVCGPADVYDYFNFAGDITPMTMSMAEKQEAPSPKPPAMADIDIDDLFD